MGHRLALERIAEAALRVDPVFRATRIVQVGGLTVKVETENPIGSFKGRGADWFVQGLGDDARPLVAASAGNFGQGLAHAARGRRVTIFAARDAVESKVAAMRALGAEVRLHGESFDAAKRAARAHADAVGARFVEDGQEPAIAEGAGGIAVELCAQARFATVLVPLGDGALLGGMARWIRHVAPATRIVGVCAAGAPAFWHAWRGHVYTGPVDTLADGIAVASPIPTALADLRATIDDVVLVDDDALRGAQRWLYQHAGLIGEPAGVAGVAAYLASPRPGTATVLTGRNTRSFP